MKKMISLLTIASVLALGGPAALAKSSEGSHRPAVTRQAPATPKHAAKGRKQKTRKSTAKQGVAKGSKTAKAPRKGAKKVASMN